MPYLQGCRFLFDAAVSASEFGHSFLTAFPGGALKRAENASSDSGGF